MNSNTVHHVRAKTPGPHGEGGSRSILPPGLFLYVRSRFYRLRVLLHTATDFSKRSHQQCGPAPFPQSEDCSKDLSRLQTARSGSPAASTLSTTSVVLPTAMFSRFRRLLERVGITHVSPSVRRCRIQLPICRFADITRRSPYPGLNPQSVWTPLRSSTEKTRPGSPKSLQPRPVARSTARPFGCADRTS